VRTSEKRARPVIDLALFIVKGSELLIVGCDQDVGKDRFESPLLILIVEHYDGSDPQGMPAGTARRHFSLQILQKSVGEVILIVRSPRCFHSRFPAIGTVVLHIIFLRIFWRAACFQRYTRPNSYLMHEAVKMVHFALDCVTPAFTAI
jgi:hypothetical protein